MFRKKRIKNFNNRVHRLYDRKFSYVEGVLNSCVTLDQLTHGAQWASTVMSQYERHEKGRLGKLCDVFTYIDLLGVVNKYFNLKQEIIGLIFERKVKEIEKHNPAEIKEN